MAEDRVVTHTLLIRMKSGYETRYTLSKKEAERVGNFIANNDEDGCFVVFDSRWFRVAINLEELAFANILFDIDPGKQLVDKEPEDWSFGVVFASGGELTKYDMDQDLEDSNDEDAELGQLHSLFFELECDATSVVTKFVNLEDGDGELCLWRRSTLALVECSHSLLKSDEEPTDEDEEKPEAEA